MDEIEGKRDVAEILDEARFEEGLEPTDLRDRGDEHDGGDHEEEPFGVCHGGGREPGEVVPPGGGT